MSILSRSKTSLRFAALTLVLFIVYPPMQSEETDQAADADAAAVAVATLTLCEDADTAIGRAVLSERASDEGVKVVDVQVDVRDMTDAAGKHAVHIHETGSCSPCGAAGGHFDPGNHGHSSPDGNHPYHSGDLINIEVDENGDGRMTTVTSRINLSEGPLSIFDDDGAALIVHVDEDSYCPGGEEAGCAGGARLACGIFQLVD